EAVDYREELTGSAEELRPPGYKDATTRLWNNGKYEMPVIMVTSTKVKVWRGPQVSHIQLKSVANFYKLKGGWHKIEPGQYRVSLYGGTYGQRYIYGHVYYK